MLLSWWQVERRCREGQSNADAQSTSWHSLALTCPRTCALCNDTTPSSTDCRLSASWRGRWTDAVTGASVTVNETAIHVTRRDDVVVMSCVRWVRDDNMTMLVTRYGAGCRPRYRCARLLRRSSSLLYLQLSQAAQWPLVHSPLHPVDCQAFNWITSPATTTSGYLLALVRDGGPSVECRLPSSVSGVQYNAEFVVQDSRHRCTGTLTESRGQTLTLSVSGDCSSVVRRRFGDSVYRCLESSAMEDGEGEVIVTSRNSSDDASTLSEHLSCWMFTRRGLVMRSQLVFVNIYPL